MKFVSKFFLIIAFGTSTTLLFSSSLIPGVPKIHIDKTGIEIEGIKSKWHQININIIEVNGFTLLMVACAQNNISSVRLLLEHGAEINKMGSCGYTALSIACYLKNIEIVRLLLEHGADANKADFYDTPIFISACSNNDIDIIELLIKHGADVHQQDVATGSSALIAACHNEISYAIIELLIQHGVSVNRINFKNETALETAAALGKVQAMQILLDNGAKIIQSGCKSAFLTALEKNQVEAANLLIKNGADVNETQYPTDFTPLMIASTVGDERMIQLLINHGAKVNKTAGNEFSPLMCAVSQGKYSCAKLLIAQGADVMHTSPDGHTAFSFFIQLSKVHDKEEIKRFLTMLLIPDSATLIKKAQEFDLAWRSDNLNGFFSVNPIALECLHEFLEELKNKKSEENGAPTQHKPRSTTTSIIQASVVLLSLWAGWQFIK